MECSFILNDFLMKICKREVWDVTIVTVTGTWILSIITGTVKYDFLKKIAHPCILLVNQNETQHYGVVEFNLN